MTVDDKPELLRFCSQPQRYEFTEAGLEGVCLITKYNDLRHALAYLACSGAGEGALLGHVIRTIVTTEMPPAAFQSQLLAQQGHHYVTACLLHARWRRRAGSSCARYGRSSRRRRGKRQPCCVSAAFQSCAADQHTGVCFGFPLQADVFASRV